MWGKYNLQQLLDLLHLYRGGLTISKGYNKAIILDRLNDCKIVRDNVQNQMRAYLWLLALPYLCKAE